MQERRASIAFLKPNLVLSLSKIDELFPVVLANSCISRDFIKIVLERV